MPVDWNKHGVRSWQVSLLGQKRHSFAARLAPATCASNSVHSVNSPTGSCKTVEIIEIGKKWRKTISSERLSMEECLPLPRLTKALAPGSKWHCCRTCSVHVAMSTLAIGLCLLLRLVDVRTFWAESLLWGLGLEGALASPEPASLRN